VQAMRESPEMAANMLDNLATQHETVNHMMRAVTSATDLQVGCDTARRGCDTARLIYRQAVTSATDEMPQQPTCLAELAAAGAGPMLQTTFLCEATNSKEDMLPAGCRPPEGSATPPPPTMDAVYIGFLEGDPPLLASEELVDSGLPSTAAVVRRSSSSRGKKHADSARAASRERSIPISSDRKRLNTARLSNASAEGEIQIRSGRLSNASAEGTQGRPNWTLAGEWIPPSKSMKKELNSTTVVRMRSGNLMNEWTT